GMNVARLNMSHGSHTEHAAAYEYVRRASQETGQAIAVLADLQGPKERLGTFDSGSVELHREASFVITSRDVTGTDALCSATYDGSHADISPLDEILIVE